MRVPGFIGPSYTLSELAADCQRVRNLYPEIGEARSNRGGEVASLVGTPGLRLLATLGSGPVRGLFLSSLGALYAVAGATLYRVSTGWVATSLGTIGTTSGPVSMADNGISLCLVDGSAGYVLTIASGAFAQITDPQFYPASHVAFLDGYFVFNRIGTGQFFISALYGTSFDSLDIATAEGHPDPVTSLIVDHREVWLFGTQTVEVWFDSGAADFPLSRNQGGFVEHGIAAPFTVAKAANNVLWMEASDRGRGVVFQAQGYQPQRVSTHAVEIEIQKSSSLADAVAWVYQQQGHLFYVLQVPGLESTWVYDIAAGLWHERTYFSDGVEYRHRGQCATFFNGVTVVGDRENGNLYALERTTYTDDGALIRRQRRSPHAIDEMRNGFFSKFQLELAAGLGLDASVQGSDPKLMLRFSGDGARTWSNERWASAGKLGEYSRLARWWQLGAARDRVWEVTQTDPIPTVWTGATIDVEGGYA